ncbi:hypothetical protein KFL_011160020 [Klebsormidium nitens]|uniref:DUF3987 domain-containing protein n=1 Tax=Klebsormidium nitens TaxID=105231 RepID=A0A1Y1IPF8_KLENI|nr:hypothetical protein KFL_011160020 [Klebsormidium nitens]|eukprot:GAQ92740.1 hypothetical protein KFL_011160020 [Klebsormidium nitens]
MPSKRSSFGDQGCNPNQCRAVCLIVDDENAKSSFPPEVLKMLHRMGKRIGVSAWMLMVPMTSCASYFLGPNALVEVDGVDWKSNLIHWGFCVGPSGFGKSQAYQKISKNIDVVERIINDEIMEHILKDLDRQVYKEGSSEFEKLMSEIKFLKVKMDGAMLDAYKKGNSDRVRALQLKGGSAWTRELVDDKCESKTCEYTHVCIGGFTQPEPLHREISKTPNDGLMNRYQTAFPPPEFPDFSQLCIGSDEQQVVDEDNDLMQKLMYRLYWLTHSLDEDKGKTIFKLTGAARDVFGQGFDSIQAVLRQLYDKDLLHKAGIISKTKGEVLQISAIFRAMSLVLEPSYLTQGEQPESLLITEDDVRQAWNFVNLTTRQRIEFENDKEVIKVCSKVLGWKPLGLRVEEDEEEDDDDEEDDNTNMDALSPLDRTAKRLFKTFRDETISRIEVSRKRTFGNNNQIMDVLNYISSKDDNGVHYFGSVEETVKGQISKLKQEVFSKLIPKSEEENIDLINNLSRIGMTLDAFLPSRARKNMKKGSPNNSDNSDPGNTSSHASDGQELEMEEA